MDPRPDIGPQQAALAHARRLTIELIELVGLLRSAVADDEERQVSNIRPAGGRLKSGDLRAAMSRANRSTRHVPHLLG